MRQDGCQAEGISSPIDSTRGEIDEDSTLERWPSGRRRAPGKCVYPKRVSWVRIPLSPRILEKRREIASKLTTRSSYEEVTFGATIDGLDAWISV